MPELPEVETIRKELIQLIQGRKIKEVLVLDSAPLKDSFSSHFCEMLKEREVKEVKRRGKILLFHIPPYFLLVHLKLTGRLLFYEKKLEKFPPFTCVVSLFSSGESLVFTDKRKFGYMKLVSKEELLRTPEIASLGPEPLEEKFTFEDFLRALSKKRKGKIKSILMEQKVISGLGNIYAAEVLFLAEVHPERELSTLSWKELKKIYEGIREILPQAISKKGSSVDEYVDVFGKKGDYVPHLKVYGRKNKPCYRCGTPIEVIKLGGRGTYFCPKCQV
jgi:formamidopyrimidine-DNA glycosylase